MQQSNFTGCLTALQKSGCEFVLVGGLAAVLQGAPVQTYDVDVVYSRSDQNVQRLVNLLNAIDAVFRIQPERRLKPDVSHLLGSGHLNLTTRFGPLDLLATIGDGLTYVDLLPHSQEMLITKEIRIRVLELDQIIALKEKLGSEKDAAVLPILRHTAREKKRQQ